PRAPLAGQSRERDPVLVVQKRGLFMAGIAIALMIAGYVFLFAPSDAERIRNELTRLAAAVEVTGDAPNPISHLAHVKGELAEIFEEDVRVTIPELPQLQSGRADLAKTATDASLYFRAASVSFAVVDLDLDATKSHALVRATAVLHLTERDGSNRLEKRLVNFQLAKTDGAWRIRTLTVLPSTEGAP
ncbi:MAG: nuclear transport factor 2 family protein, partial [Polyangiaceae bacterium]